MSRTRRRHYDDRRNERRRPNSGYGRRATVYESTCSSGKWSWETRALAEDYLSGRDPGFRREVTAYPCSECERYHLGHQPEPVRLGLVSRADYYAGSFQDRLEWKSLAKAYRDEAAS